MYKPYNYDEINIAAGSYSPSMVKAYNNQVYDYWVRSLFQRACSTLKFTVPVEWQGKTFDFFMYCLFKYGYIAVSKNAEFGTFFQPCTINGISFYYQPVNAIISNPLYQATLEIGTECEILKLTPDYKGIFDIISYYAEKLSVLDNAINISLINNKYAFMLAARNKAAGEALKKMLDKVNKGEPAVVYDMKLINDPTDKDTPWQEWSRPGLKESYLTTDQLRDFQTILNSFDNEIGIPTVPYEKKERMVQSEAESRQMDATSRCLTWFNTIKGSIAEIKKLYPDINLDVEMRFNPDDLKEEVANYGE